jgi:hypothetical protein
MPTSRLSEEAYEEVKAVAEENDKPMVEVVDEMIAESGDGDGGAVIGYCPGCGHEFTEGDRISRWVLMDAVRCPTKSCVKHGNTGKVMKIGKLTDDPPEHTCD